MIVDPPLISTHYTRIWETAPNKNKYPALLKGWLVDAPWMHPLWRYHWVTLIHLRDLTGNVIPIDGRKAKLQAPGFTHELTAFAQNPSVVPNSLSSEDCICPLLPISIAQQFKSDSDGEAIFKIDKLIEWVAAGNLSLDSDYRNDWYKILVEY